MVPIKEMTDVLKVVKETAALKPKQWVRLKRGIFKDDLAQVSCRLSVFIALLLTVLFEWMVLIITYSRTSHIAVLSWLMLFTTITRLLY